MSEKSSGYYSPEPSMHWLLITAWLCEVEFLIKQVFADEEIDSAKYQGANTYFQHKYVELMLCNDFICKIDHRKEYDSGYNCFKP